MMYSIGEVAKQTGIAISTLRYYDREGMFPEMTRSQGGIRAFSEKELATLKVIECLKTSGLSIKEIKEFLRWCQEGDTSLQDRRDLFYNRLEAVEQQIAELQKTLQLLKYKCWYYDTALAKGTEAVMGEQEVPEALRPYKL